MNRVAWLAMGVMLTVGCGGNDWTPPEDGQTDEGSDTAVDSSVDSGEDTMEDTPSDTSTEEVDECGNGEPDAGEECDDGVNDGSYGGCNDDCSLAPYCGDGDIDDDHEECDDGEESDACQDTCEFWPDEVDRCDDGVDNDADGLPDCFDRDCRRDLACRPEVLDILVYVETCSDALDHVTPALTRMGMLGNTTFVSSPDELVTSLSGGDRWDLVIVDNYNANSGGIMDALLTYYDDGGSIILFAWDLEMTFHDHDIVDRGGFYLREHFDEPLPVFAWESDPLFTVPNEVPDFVAGVDHCGYDGQKGQRTGDGEALAGYTATDAWGEAALVVDGEHRFINNLFGPQTVEQDADSDTVADMVELYENEISTMVGRKVLVLWDQCSTGADHVTPALNHLGLSDNVVFAESAGDFQRMLEVRNWHLVITDNYGGSFTPSLMDALVDHYDSGGRLIFASYDLFLNNPSHSLLDRAGISVSGDYTAVESVYAWDSDPLFMMPNEVPDLVPAHDLCTRDGQYAQTTVGTALAGYSETVADDMTAICIDVNDRFIVHTFTSQNMEQDEDGDTVQDMVELYENEIRHIY